MGINLKIAESLSSSANNNNGDTQRNSYNKMEMRNHSKDIINQDIRDVHGKIL